MLPSMKPLVTAAPLFCLWKPNTTPLPAMLLLLYSWKAWSKVADPMNVVLAFTRRVLPLLAPIVVLPNAANVLPAEMLTGALSRTGAVKLDEACTVTDWLLLAPRVTFPLAVKGAVAAKATGAVNVDVAPTLSIWALLLPSTTLPEAVSKPATLTALVAVIAAAALMGAAAVNTVAALKVEPALTVSV